ncbi:MAG: hypothetical protein QOJ99_2856, partial [Bryobacterales bacterium]|nr:hypothetical protein [Bryobacterales bacterium]
NGGLQDLDQSLDTIAYEFQEWRREIWENVTGLGCSGAGQYQYLNHCLFYHVCINFSLRRSLFEPQRNGHREEGIKK